MVELLETSDTSTERDREVAESLSALLNGGGSKKKTPSVRRPPFAPQRLLSRAGAVQCRTRSSEAISVAASSLALESLQVLKEHGEIRMRPL